MPANLATPWTVGGTLALALVLALALAPGLAYAIVAGFKVVRDALEDFALATGRNIKDLWRLSGEKDREIARRQRKVEEDEDIRNMREQIRSEKTPDAREAKRKIVQPEIDALMQAKLDDLNKKRGEAKDPDIMTIAFAWARRLIYLVLAIVCLGSDYVLVSSRAPLLFGGGTPPAFLLTLFKYLQVITGLLFVSIAALSGMLIQEQTRGLADAIKLYPDIGDTERKIRLGLSITMFITDVSVIIALTLAGVDIQFGVPQPLWVIYVIFIGASALVALGVLLAWDGLIQGGFAVGFLVVGGAAALGSLLVSWALAFLQVLLRALDALNRAIFNRGPGEAVEALPDEQRMLAIVGYGDWGSEFARDVCGQIGQLFGRYARVAAFYSPRPGRLQGQFVGTGAATQVLTVDARRGAQSAASALIKRIQGAYAAGTNDKPVVWIASGDDLTECFNDLKTLDQGTNVTNFKLVIVWRLPATGGERSESLVQTARDLRDWAQTSTLLTTTVVIDEDATLAQDLEAKEPPVLHRSLAALLCTPGANFAGAVTQLHARNLFFAGLAAGTVGVQPGTGNPNEDKKGRRGGDVDVDRASAGLTALALEVFKENRLSTVHNAWTATFGDPLAAVQQHGTGTTGPQRAIGAHALAEEQAGVFVNVVVPARLRQPQQFKDAITEWLSRAFGVNSGHISVMRITRPGDRGIDVKRTKMAHLQGRYYLQFTVLRGLDTAPEGLTAGGSGGW